MQTPLLKFAMGCHRNHEISHSPYQNFFEDTFVSHPGGPNEQFGTHEKFSWGGGVQCNLNWMPGYNSVPVKTQKKCSARVEGF